MVVTVNRACEWMGVAPGNRWLARPDQSASLFAGSSRKLRNSSHVSNAGEVTKYQNKFTSTT